MKHMKSGFTLIEVSIFLVITALLFFGVTIGVQNSVYQQRVNDSVQSFVEFLRGVYSGAQNVQNSASGGGKSDQAIYGRVAVFDNNTVKVYSVVGAANAESFSTLGAKVSDEAPIDEYTPKWGARLENKDNENLIKGSMLVMRDPSSGMLNTYWSTTAVMVGDNVTVGSGFNASQIDYCLKPDGGQKSNRRDVRIGLNSRNASGIVLYTDEGNNCR